MKLRLLSTLAALAFATTLSTSGCERPVEFATVESAM